MITIEDIQRLTPAGYLPVTAALVNIQPINVELTDNMTILTSDLVAELAARSRLDNGMDMVDTKALHALYINLGTELAIRAALHSFPDLAGADEFIDSQLPKD